MLVVKKSANLNKIFDNNIFIFNVVSNVLKIMLKYYMKEADDGKNKFYSYVIFYINWGYILLS